MATYQQVLKRFATKYLQRIETEEDKVWLRENTYTLWCEPEFIEEFHAAMKSTSNQKGLDVMFEAYKKEYPSASIEWLYNNCLDEELESRITQIDHSE